MSFSKHNFIYRIAWFSSVVKSTHRSREKHFLISKQSTLSAVKLQHARTYNRSARSKLSSIFHNQEMTLYVTIDQHDIRLHTVSTSIGSIFFSFCRWPEVFGSKTLPMKRYTWEKSGRTASNKRALEYVYIITCLSYTKPIIFISNHRHLMRGTHLK